MNTSPFLNPYPGRVTLNDVTSNNVDPIPVVELAPTSTFNSNPVPDCVVDPIPNLETPTIGKFSYIGSGVLTIVFVTAYPVPPDVTTNDRDPPAPTTAETIAPCPVLEVTAMLTDPRYPEPDISVDPIPTAVILPPTPITAVTAAPTNGAYPNPLVDPREIIVPPLGS